MRLRKHGNELPRPVSLATEVIRTWSMPQGTIHSNGWRSLSTFTARPWVVTPRDTCTPIEPILRSPAHTPVNGLPRASAAMPSSRSAPTIARSSRPTNRATPSIAITG